MSARLNSYELTIYSPRHWSLTVNFVHLRSNKLRKISLIFLYVIRLFKVGQIKQTAQVYEEIISLCYKQVTVSFLA